MAKISSPIGPTIDVVAQTVSRSVISGGGGGRGRTPSGGGAGGGGEDTGRGGAIIVRPQASLVDRTQNLQIQTTQQSVGTLQQSLNVVNVYVRDLGNNLNTLRSQLLLEGQVEQQNLKNEQDSEKKLRERKVRLGRESQIEQNIAAAIAKPILTLQKKVTSLFERITGALTTLFFGWLTNQGIETLKAFAEGDSKKLEEIKNNVIKNVLFAVGAFTAVNIGFGLLMRTITGLTLRLAGFAAKLALAPFRLAISAVGRLLGIGRMAPAAAQTARAARPLITGSTNMLTKMFNFTRGFNLFGRGAGAAGARTASRFIPGLNVIAGGVSTAYDLSQGNLPGAALSALSMIPGFGIPFALARVGYGAATGEFSGGQQPAPTPAAQPQTPALSAPPAATPPPPSPASTPQASMMPQPAELTITPSASSQQPAASATETQQVDLNGMNVDMSKIYQLPISPAQIQGQTSQAPKIEPLAEPKPNIIIAGGEQDKTQVVPMGQQQPLTDVPFIPSSNPDNFYVLYSQLNYNVVM
jgi:hypothetical protein